MSEIPKEILQQFFQEQGVRNLVIQDFGYTSELSAHGDFNEYQGKELAVYRLAVLLSIVEGSYINDPNLGVNLIRYIYRPMNEANIDSIKNELQSKISKYEKDFFLRSVSVKKDTTYKRLYLVLDLKYIPDEDDIILEFDFIKDIQALMLRAI